MHGAARWLDRLPAEWYIGPGSILDPGTLIAGSRFSIMNGRGEREEK
jgi:hypothetical protein